MDSDHLQLLEYLSEYVTENKKQLIEEVLSVRSEYVVAVLEDIYQSQNASAVIRTCDGVGMQTVYVIENSNPYVVNPDVTLGTTKWIDIQRYNKPEVDNTRECLEDLRSQGYRIIGTTVDNTAPSIFDLDISDPIALVYGHEKNGISQTVINGADRLVHIPMYGFVESFNISVSAAVSLYTLYNRIRNSDVAWQLSEEKKLQIKLNWFRKIVPRGEIIESEFWKKHQKEC